MKYLFNFNLQTIGARNIKTSLSVFLCIIIFELLGRSSAFFACIAAMMCMQDTVENSYKMGKNRMLGTSIGAVVGLTLTAIFNLLDLQHFIIYALLTAIGTTIAIYLCILFNCKGAVNSACIVVFAIMTSLKGVGSYNYAFNRILDTFIGVIIGILVNRFVYPYSKTTEEDTN